MKKTLLLNNDFSPICLNPLSVISWQESVKLILTEKASVVFNYPDEYVHSPSLTMNIPSAIALRDYVGAQNKVKYSRFNIYLRDEYKCQYCGLYAYENQKETLTLDHVIPKARGGKSTFDNIVTACSSCNMEKAHYMKMKPINKPYKPSYFQLVKKRKKFPIVLNDPRWIDLLGWDKELVEINEVDTDFILDIS